MASEMDFGGLVPPHVSVLYQPIITALRPRSPGFYVDATVGAGGHAWGILEQSSPDGKLLGLDVDPRALELAHQRLFSLKTGIIWFAPPTLLFLRSCWRLAGTM